MADRKFARLERAQNLLPNRPSGADNGKCDTNSWSPRVCDRKDTDKRSQIRS